MAFDAPRRGRAAAEFLPPVAAAPGRMAWNRLSAWTCCGPHIRGGNSRHAAARDDEVAPARRALVIRYRESLTQDEILVPCGTCQPLENWRCARALRELIPPFVHWSRAHTFSLIHCRKREMKTPIALALLAILAFATSPAAVAERACRPSLSNGYHCPDTAAQTKRPTQPTRTSGRDCRPSLSNLWTCPDTSQPRPRSTSTDRPCRPSLSNGYSCPEPSTDGRGSAPTRSERECRPSLSNGYNCSGAGQAGADQYTTETLARVHCPTDTVVWANTGTGVYHFRNTSYYGNTKAGAYMCERAALAKGIRAARNEKHP